MPKKTKALAVRKVEILPPTREIPDARAAIEQLVEQKIAEIMGSGDAIFEAFFRSKQIADEIRRLETIPMQRKWPYYFETWGCLICESKSVPHRSLGMCFNCYRRTAERLARYMRGVEAEPESSATVQDLEDLARKARRMEIWHQARALHFGQKLTWREIAQRLDPDFAKDPKAAISRIKSGAHRVPLVRDLQDVARKALRK